MSHLNSKRDLWRAYAALREGQSLLMPDGPLRSKFHLADAVLTAPAYKQDNGFWTFMLADHQPAQGPAQGNVARRSLRLHYWQAQSEEVVPSFVHNHIFNFRSRVLFAEQPLINTELEIDYTGDGPFDLIEVAYRNYHDQELRRRASGINLREIAEIEIDQGEDYSFGSGKYHLSRVKNGAEAITLLAAEYDTSDWPCFVTAKNTQPNGDNTRQSLTPSEREMVAARLEAVL